MNDTVLLPLLALSLGVAFWRLGRGVSWHRSPGVVVLGGEGAVFGVDRGRALERLGLTENLTSSSQESSMGCREDRHGQRPCRGSAARAGADG
jgi:hypothetical protein